MFVHAEALPGAWKLPSNPVWNVPDGVSEVRFDIEFWPGPHQVIRKLRGLCIDLKGNVYGERSLSDREQDGYVMRGRVSIGGVKVRAFTGSRMFERPDGSLVNVAVLIATFPE